jgi:rhodanese-related sulfurtransferase
MNVKYLISGGLLVLLALALLLLPARQKQNEISPEQLAEKINDPSRFISSDEIAERLIEKEPSLQLIDVRSAEEYNQYSLPGAVNIPLSSLLDSASLELLRAEGMESVFFSNSDLTADQAWILCTRLQINNIRVMKGGLNVWFQTILQPSRPPESAPSEDHDLYMFRLAASQYFLGGEVTGTGKGSSEEPVIVKKRTKKSGSEGGC